MQDINKVIHRNPGFLRKPFQIKHLATVSPQRMNKVL
jgi:hypothetical protein